MKLIVVHASCGAGHTKAAQAIYTFLTKRNQAFDCKLVDVLESSGGLFRYSYIYGYAALVLHAPFLWFLAFSLTQASLLHWFTRPIAIFLNRLQTRRFSDFLIRENPDFIISTHFLSSEIAASLKKSGKIKSRLLTVITDFGVHPFWISYPTDYYIVSSAFTKRQLLNQRIEEEHIKDIGIPVDEKFYAVYQRNDIAQKLNLEYDKFTVLIMTGSFGTGPLEEIACALEPFVQVIVVCARNDQLYRRLKARGLSNVRIYGFVDNIHELMAVSDVMITKPGGLSISEALAMELIPVFISAIPGQEIANIEALKESGVGMYFKEVATIKEAVLDLKSHPEKLASMKEDIQLVKKPDTLEGIYDVICKSSPGAGS
ncbi:MAG: glycosyltransferase [Candidatus Omnitrophica bacterium]|nr:glycosyltransferase [Candidatus Omnitrophota bacterium]